MAYLPQIRTRMPRYKTEEKLPRCLNCGAVLSRTPGRPDRKFCCRDCKNAYHNAHRKVTAEQYHSRINRVLENNYGILRHLIAMGVTSIDRRTLKDLHFNLEFSTSYCKVGNRHHYACFEIHYDVTPTRAINIENILEKQPELSSWDP